MMVFNKFDDFNFNDFIDNICVLLDYADSQHKNVCDFFDDSISLNISIDDFNNVLNDNSVSKIEKSQYYVSIYRHLSGEIIYYLYNNRINIFMCSHVSNKVNLDIDSNYLDILSFDSLFCVDDDKNIEDNLRKIDDFFEKYIKERRLCEMFDKMQEVDVSIEIVSNFFSLYISIYFNLLCRLYRKSNNNINIYVEKFIDFCIKCMEIDFSGILIYNLSICFYFLFLLFFKKNFSIDSKIDLNDFFEKYFQYIMNSNQHLFKKYRDGKNYGHLRFTLILQFSVICDNLFRDKRFSQNSKQRVIRPLRLMLISNNILGYFDMVYDRLDDYSSSNEISSFLVYEMGCLLLAMRLLFITLKHEKMILNCPDRSFLSEVYLRVLKLFKKIQSNDIRNHFLAYLLNMNGLYFVVLYDMIGFLRLYKPIIKDIEILDFCNYDDILLDMVIYTERVDSSGILLFNPGFFC